METLFAVMGAGGFGREVMPMVQDDLAMTHRSEYCEAVFVIEDQYAESTPKKLNGQRVLTMSQFLRWDGEKRYVLAIQKSDARQRIAESLPPDVLPFNVRGSLSGVFDGNEIGAGSILCNFTQITSNATIGKHFHLNLFSCVEHDCRIGDYVTFSPGVKCSGRVVIEDHVFVGAGAVIRDGSDKPMVIGRGAVIGMGAVVTKSVPPGVTVVGNPARPLERRAP
jgi:sugar O-acyltransferase (sialic acid O-acetyltransferase NeuD family)